MLCGTPLHSNPTSSAYFVKRMMLIPVSYEAVFLVSPCCVNKAGACVYLALLMWKIEKTYETL